MLVVLDSNLFFSALISPHGSPALCYRAWRERRYELATCPEQIEEIRRASRHSHLRTIVEPHEVGEMLNNIGRAKSFTLLQRKRIGTASIVTAAVFCDQVLRISRPS